MQADLLQVAPALEAFHAALDDEEPDAVALVGHGPCRDDHDVRELPVGDVRLRSVQQPVVAFVLGARLHAGHVAAGARLRHCDRQDLLALDERGQETGLLLVVAELAEVRPDQARVQVEVEARLAVADVLLDQHLFVAEIGDARAAVFFVGPHQQVALLAGLQVGLAVDHALLAPALRMRRDFGLEEAPGAVAERVVLGLEDGAAHGHGNGRSFVFGSRGAYLARDGPADHALDGLDHVHHDVGHRVGGARPIPRGHPGEHAADRHGQHARLVDGKIAAGVAFLEQLARAAGRRTCAVRSGASARRPRGSSPRGCRRRRTSGRGSRWTSRARRSAAASRAARDPSPALLPAPRSTR